MNDVINGLFELCGAALLWKNVLQVANTVWVVLAWRWRDR